MYISVLFVVFCVFVFFFCSHWSLVDVSLIFFCPADHVPDWQPRILLGMVEARSVVVVVVVFTLKAVPVSTQYFLTSVLVQLTRTPSVVTG